MKALSQHSTLTPAALAIRRSIVAIILLGVPGCTHLGPRTIPRDRFDYSSSVADSWKQQTLLNIVKIRYMDLPIFMDVAQIVSGYTLETGVNVGGQVSSANAIQGNSLLFGTSGRFTDRPTITYSPMTGEKFLKGLITPIDPKNIFFMLQAGYAADFVLGLTVDSLNGLRNRSISAGAVREADPEFVRVLELLHDIQDAGAMGLRVEEEKAKGQTGVVFFRRDNIAPEVLAKIEEVRRLLQLPAGQQRFKLAYSPVRGADDELAVSSRSMIQMMAAFASYIEIPESDLKEGRALPGIKLSEEDAARMPVRVRSSKDKPKDAFATVWYRDRWFWIEDRDWRSKRAFTAIMFFFTLADTGTNERLPLITIPAG